MKMNLNDGLFIEINSGYKRYANYYHARTHARMHVRRCPLARDPAGRPRPVSDVTWPEGVRGGEADLDLAQRRFN